MAGSRTAAGSANGTFIPRNWKRFFERSWPGGQPMRVRVSRLWLALVSASVMAGQPAPQAEAVLRHAVELHQSGAFEGAVAEYRAYLKQNPGSIIARSNLGAALSRLGRYEEAIA